MKEQNKILPESLFEYREYFLNEDSVGFSEITDIDTYTKEMSKGVKDKIEFLSKISPDCIVDFGCADGYILNQIKSKYPNIKEFIGYDVNEKMISLVKSKYPSIKVTDNWNEAIYEASEYDDVALTLMSVIHEVYSYGTPQSIRNFWKYQVFNPKFKWVVIRDMVPSKQYMSLKPTKEEIKKINSPFSTRYYSNLPYRRSFEKKWGKITDSYKNLFHWLLKYDYKRNWKREVMENYLPVSLETIKSKIPSGWSIIYEDYYVYEPIAEKVKKDWGIELKYPTHLKMIIENKTVNK